LRRSRLFTWCRKADLEAIVKSVKVSVWVLVLFAIGASQLTGCAADPRYREGVNWVVSNEQEKARLQAQGFPQYSDGPN
jgi:hypothetical protein